MSKHSQNISVAPMVDSFHLVEMEAPEAGERTTLSKNLRPHGQCLSVACLDLQGNAEIKDWRDKTKCQFESQRMESTEQ